VTAPAVLAGSGFRLALPPGWEGRISRRSVPTAAFTPAARAAVGPDAAGAGGWAGEQMLPVVHAGNFALPATRGDYGSGAVEVMGAGAAFLAVLEFGPECLGTALYAPAGLPRLTFADFAPNALQRRIVGQLGCQVFCTVARRPLGVYAVLGSAVRAGALLDQLNAVLAGTTVEAR
jgi:hypothetical protein